MIITLNWLKLCLSNCHIFNASTLNPDPPNVESTLSMAQWVWMAPITRCMHFLTLWLGSFGCLIKNSTKFLSSRNLFFKKKTTVKYFKHSLSLVPDQLSTKYTTLQKIAKNHINNTPCNEQIDFQSYTIAPSMSC